MFVVCYDISNDRRRLRLFKTLKGYGMAVQESVFECHLTAEQFVRMQADVEKVIKPQEDQVRYYNLCPNCSERVQATAASLTTSDPAAIVV